MDTRHHLLVTMLCYDLSAYTTDFVGGPCLAGSLWCVVGCGGLCDIIVSLAYHEVHPLVDMEGGDDGDGDGMRICVCQATYETPTGWCAL